MASYPELHTLRTDSDLQERVALAIIKKGQALLDSVTPSAAQVLWANAAVNSPESKRPGLLNYVLAVNSASSVATIQAATDATIQSNVDAAVDVLIAGGA